ncbi:fatty acid desaturase family protein [Streptomyces formicae]|uniref:Acyl-CoA desaturase n=1 Tax=Streptomyces formicae TaxID=1616117 RepID=A0ABY3WKC1_9ACTN|nr:acyl-CoA desaturase [Streptomyces formicae]UNM13054.1 acyl-CoA desaturase [Streptomyces formicae]
MPQASVTTALAPEPGPHPGRPAGRSADSSEDRPRDGSEGRSSDGSEDRPRDRSGGSDFAPLLRTAKEQGLLGRRTGWYARVIAVNLLALAAVVTAIALIGPSWWVLPLAAPLAVLSARTAFIAHDAGHAQITPDRRTGRIIQLFHGNLLLGMSQDWWNDKHNRHHANPNHVDKDPDVAPDVLVFSKDHTGGRTGFRGWLTRHQAWLFFPLTTLEGIALKAHGFRHVFSRSADSPSGARGRARDRAVEGGLLVAHAVGYAALLLTALTPLQALVFALLHQMLLGLHLGMAFAPNHKGMAMPGADGGQRWGHLQRQVLTSRNIWGHLQRQVLTSRNIRGGALTDWLLGGLNYQIEHHLFPSMPRPHLRLVQPLVRAHCRRQGLPYTETGLIDSYRQALGHLHEVGGELRAARGTS